LTELTRFTGWKAGFAQRTEEEEGRGLMLEEGESGKD
jgi:hypothetical protein